MFSSGMQYYISGRYAVLAGLIPVAGNLLHHAIEMFLKGGLARASDLKELKRLRHNVPETWKLFKVRFEQPELDRFDSVINSVHAFEDLRYPDSLLLKGARMMVGVSGAAQLGKAEQIGQVPSYELYLSEIDPLVHSIFTTASVDARFLYLGMNSRAHQYFTEGNLPTWAV